MVFLNTLQTTLNFIKSVHVSYGVLNTKQSTLNLIKSTLALVHKSILDDSSVELTIPYIVYISVDWQSNKYAKSNNE
jgi:hypothetical protein